MVRITGIMALLALVAASGCSEFAIVPNPAYTGWAEFGAGSSVTFEGTQDNGTGEVPFRLTQTRLESSEDVVVLEVTLAILTGDQAGPSQVTRTQPDPNIFATDHPTTDPDSEIEELANEAVMIDGQAIECEVTEIVLVEKLVLLPGVLEFGPLDEAKLQLTLYRNESIPGGIVKSEELRTTTTRSHKENLHVVEYHVVEK